MSIVIAPVMVEGVAGFLVCWFVLKKRKKVRVGGADAGGRRLPGRSDNRRVQH
jgi:hypothetical protein